MGLRNSNYLKAKLEIMATLLNVPVKRILVIALFALIGCKDSDKNSSLIFEELNESLERSNKAINISSTIYLNLLNDKRQKPEMAEKARKWGTFADSIHSKTSEILNFIEELKTQLKNDDAKINFDKKIKLFEGLKNFREYVLNQNEEIKKQFDSITPVANFGFGKRFNNKKSFAGNALNSSIGSKNVSEILKFENDIRNTEYEVIAYCYNSVPNNWDGYEEFSPISFQNSTHFRSGEELIIKLGIGHTTLRNMPSFRINDFLVSANEEGMGVYRMKVEEKPGSYKVPVSISYYQADGRRDSVYKFIEYTVDK